MRRLAAFALAVLFLTPGFAVGAPAKGETTDKENEVLKTTVAEKEIEGEVSWLGKNKIAVVYNRDAATGGEYEMQLSFDKDVIIQHKKSLDEIHRGDIVNVKYDEITDEYKDKYTKTKAKAKIISFVKPAQPGVGEAGTLSAGQQALPLKGVKGD